MELAEYYKRRLEKEAKERRVAKVQEVPYNKIWEALEELKAISHPNEQDVQSQRRSAFERLGPNGS
jgi:hypothetical protein